MPSPDPPDPSPAIPIVHPSTPMADDDAANGGPPPNVSPSFDYHEERRLHLQDEIWMSHHLPRLPPASVQDPSTNTSIAVGSLSPTALMGTDPSQIVRSPPRERKAKERPIPSNVALGQPMSDVSPSAFHHNAQLGDVPRHAYGGSRMILEDGEEDENEDRMSGRGAPSLAASLHLPASLLDPEASGDFQERLNLAEEQDESQLGAGFAERDDAEGMTDQQDAAGELTCLPPPRRETFF